MKTNTTCCEDHESVAVNDQTQTMSVWVSPFSGSPHVAAHSVTLESHCLQWETRDRGMCVWESRCTCVCIMKHFLCLSLCDFSFHTRFTLSATIDNTLFKKKPRFSCWFFYTFTLFSAGPLRFSLLFPLKVICLIDMLIGSCTLSLLRKSPDLCPVSSDPLRLLNQLDSISD